MWYKIGTVDVTNNDPIVTGTGTFWSAQIKIGDIFRTIGDTLYEVLTVDSDTQLTLAVPYSGTTDTAIAYTIIRNFTFTTNSQLALDVAGITATRKARDTELSDWSGGVVGGGPNLNGEYPLTDDQGVTVLIKCPAKIEEDNLLKADKAGDTFTGVVNIVDTVATPFKLERTGSSLNCNFELKHTAAARYLGITSTGELSFGITDDLSALGDNIWHEGNLDKSEFLSAGLSDTAAGVISFANSTGLKTDMVGTYSGEQLAICGGDSYSHMTEANTGTSEILWIGAENGVRVVSSSDNWATSWAGRYEVTLLNQFGNATFPADLNAASLSQGGTTLDNTYLGLNGGTITGTLLIAGSSAQIRFENEASTLLWAVGSTGAAGSDFIIHDNIAAVTRFGIDETTGNISMTTPTLAVSGTISEGGTLLSDKYLLKTGGTMITTSTTIINKDGVASPIYSTGQLELRTTDANDVALGFHRSGYTACALIHESNGLKLVTTNHTTAANFSCGAITATTVAMTGGTLTGRLVVPTDNRDAGVFGTYDSAKTQHIWSMGVAYRNSATGASFGNLYGLAYKYNLNSGGHGIHVCSNGTATVSLGTNIWSSGNVIAYSDRRVKTNIEVIPDALSKVKKLSGYTFDRTDTDDLSRQTGVIAQEVLEVLPEAVLGDEESHYSVAYGNMVGLLIEAVKELSEKVEELENK